jgi:hypothetical protein
MKQNVCTVGIDLAKKIFHLVGTDITESMEMLGIIDKLR